MPLISIYYNALYKCRLYDEFIELYKYIAGDDRISNFEFLDWEREYNHIIDEKLGEFAE